MEENIRNTIKIVWYMGAIFTALGLLVTAFAESFFLGMVCVCWILLMSGIFIFF